MSLSPSESLLLDSHVFLWLLYQPDKIGTQAAESILTAEAVYLSEASLWELTNKYAIAKLAFPPERLFEGAEALNLKLLSIKKEHLTTLPFIKLAHRDPFDRMLLAQAHAEKFDFLTADKRLLQSRYDTVNAHA